MILGKVLNICEPKSHLYNETIIFLHGILRIKLKGPNRRTKYDVQDILIPIIIVPDLFCATSFIQFSDCGPMSGARNIRMNKALTLPCRGQDTQWCDTSVCAFTVQDGGVGRCPGRCQVATAY